MPADKSTPTPLPPAIAALIAHGNPRQYRRGSILINEGDGGDTLILLLEGRVRVFGTSVDHKGAEREIIYGEIAAPSYFGEMSLDGGPRSASVEALTPCRCVIVTRERVRQQLAHSPELAQELIARIIARARAATDSLRDMALLDSYGRLRQALQALATPNATGTFPQRIQAGTTHASLAQRVGCSREMISRMMRDLQAGGYVHTEGRAIYVAKELPLRW